MAICKSLRYIYGGLFCIALLLLVIGFSRRPSAAPAAVPPSRCAAGPATRLAPPRQVTVTNYNASWCGWSKKLQPTWDSVAAAFKDTDIAVVDMKCDANQANKKKCQDAGIEGFPSILLSRPDGAVFEYLGDRTLEDITKWIKTSAVAPTL